VQEEMLYFLKKLSLHDSDFHFGQVFIAIWFHKLIDDVQTDRTFLQRMAILPSDIA
jgi:hypothetical protein